MISKIGTAALRVALLLGCLFAVACGGTTAPNDGTPGGAGGTGGTGAAGGSGGTGGTGGSGGTGGAGGSGGVVNVLCDAPPTWEDFMQPLTEGRCIICHSARNTGAQRNGAPVGVDFDTEEDTIRHADRILTEVSAGRMPVGAPLAPCMVENVRAWVESLGCIPACEGRVCGDDGCGGVCGTCEGAQEACLDGACICEPDCDGRSCGDDGCGGSCGTCAGAQEACVDGACVCEPDCDGRLCGPDGCGGSCGTCDDGLVCNTAAGVCVTECTPDCDGRACGDDGCSGSCGTCEGAQDACVDGACVCVPDCAGRSCGDDGCGGSCGTCGGNSTCDAAGQCVCTPSCAPGQTCGDDGCGGSCGTCGPGQICGPRLTCEADTRFSGAVYPILAGRCTGCHPGNGDLDLGDAASAYADLVGVTSSGCGPKVRVVPFDSAGSYLITKLTGGAGICGERMPQGGPYLSAAQIDVIRGWIDRGAPND